MFSITEFLLNMRTPCEWLKLKSFEYKPYALA